MSNTPTTLSTVTCDHVDLQQPGLFASDVGGIPELIAGEGL